MIKKNDWMRYIRRINEGDYTIVFEHSKCSDRHVYIVDILYREIVDDCSYQAYRKYRKFLHSIPGRKCNKMN